MGQSWCLSVCKVGFPGSSYSGRMEPMLASWRNGLGTSVIGDWSWYGVNLDSTPSWFFLAVGWWNALLPGWEGAGG